ncbi:unnamed protein product [Leptosia nina]|uniref:Serine protease K12H4.7 n=1 Tax=Leptosia nina TaxID=320188 RepID=A0AAV1ISS2_9NEOP
MRYYENLQYFRPNGPVFIYLGGEAEANPRFLSTGIVYELAKETSGAMFMTEHRYYGKSLPFEDVFVNIDHMQWLSSRQALADIATLIKNIKSSPIFKTCKIVVIGGSYSGNLAAWMRLMYFELVDAAIASSSPVLAKKDFFEYLEKVNENYELYGTTNCLDDVRDIFAQSGKMLETSEGRKELQSKYNICPECDLNVLENQWVFYTYMTEKFMVNSQYGGPRVIKKHCSNLELIDVENDSNETDSNCLDVNFNSMIEETKRTPWAYSWLYQTCTEFGYFQTTSSTSQPFGDTLPLEYFIKTCVALYGPNFNEDKVDKAVAASNAFYGGLKPNVSRVVFSNGDADPWSTIGVLEDLTYQAPAVVINRASHCADLFPQRADATEEIKQASREIKYLIKNWIGVEKSSFD